MKQIIPHVRMPANLKVLSVYRDLNVATSRSVFAGPYFESSNEVDKFGKAFLDMTEGFLALPICIPGTAVWKAKKGRLYILDLLEKAAARSKTAMKVSSHSAIATQRLRPAKALATQYSLNIAVILAICMHLQFFCHQAWVSSSLLLWFHRRSRFAASCSMEYGCTSTSLPVCMYCMTVNALSTWLKSHTKKLLESF